MWQRFRITALAIFLLLAGLVIALPRPAQGDKISDLEAKIAGAQNQEKTLSSEIDHLNNEIDLTKLKIESTSDKLDRLTGDIASVSGKIDRIEDSLAHVSIVLANRIAATYITGRTDPVYYLLSAKDFSDLLARFDYFRIVQKHDKTLMIQMATTRKNYHDQKDLLEDKKKQVEELSRQLKIYQENLAEQNEAKQSLLRVTQNDEKRYQQLLAQAKAEAAAVNASQFSGKKAVKKGDIIGLMGNTGFSSGAHLHFGVYDLAEDKAAYFNYSSGNSNPLSYLEGRTLSVNGDGCNSSTVTSTGDWAWPMSNPVITQCYGKTKYYYFYYSGIHDGLDMVDLSDSLVRAVADGVAYSYRGSGSLGNNVRIFHSNGKMTLYLHLQ